MQNLREKKQRGERITALTAYDYPTARLLDEAGIDVILVGDSLGMVVLGYQDTTEVTLAEMLHHTRAVARGVKRALLVADLPIHTYDTPAEALANARLLMAAGAQAVKLEGGVVRASQIEAIADAGIPLMGHIGMLPQSVAKRAATSLRGAHQRRRRCCCATRRPSKRRCVCHGARDRRGRNGAADHRSGHRSDDRHRLGAKLRRRDPGDA
jgi:3-methyl-2-oxobutanoate hydroxymethyltransferase